MISRLTPILIIVSSAFACPAQESATISPLRPVSTSYTAHFGSSRLSDTYLTPLKYDGITFGLEMQRTQAMKFRPSTISSWLYFSIDADRTHNPSRNSTIWNADVDIEWAMLWRHKFPYSISAGIGPGIHGMAGALYSTRNGNNPVAARAAATLDAAGFISWRTRVGRCPLAVTYRTSIPLTGVFFSPDYGELYYEIWVGNRSGLTHAAWPGNYFAMINLLTAELNLGGTSLNIGYRGSILSSKESDIVSQRFTHAVSIGLSGEWITLNPRKSIDSSANVILAY